MRVRELESVSNLRQCLLDDVHVMYFHAAPDAGALEATLRANVEIRKICPAGIWGFNLAVPMLSLPDREFQKKASEAAKSVEGYLRGAVVVLPGEGFWVSAARAFVAGMMLLTPTKGNREFANDIQAGAQNLAKRSERDVRWGKELGDTIEAWVASPSRP